MVARTLNGRRLSTRGRPSKRDESTTNAIVAAIRGGACRRDAAKAGGIARSTLMAWLARGRDGEGGYSAFLSAVRQADRLAADPVRRSLDERLEEWRRSRRPPSPDPSRLSRGPDVRARRHSRKGGRVLPIASDEIERN